MVKKSVTKKFAIMNVSMEPDLHALVKKQAGKRHMSVSRFVCKWLENYPFSTENIIPVVIDVPDHLAKNKEEMTEFLQKKCQQIASALCD
jgi:hypothetical protein